MMSTNYPTKEMFSAAATQWRCWLQWTHSHSTSESQFQGWKTPKLIVFGHNGLFNNGSSCHCVGCWVLGCSYQWANFWSPLPPLSSLRPTLLPAGVSGLHTTQHTAHIIITNKPPHQSREHDVLVAFFLNVWAVTSRAGNKPSQRMKFHNDGEGP